FSHDFLIDCVRLFLVSLYILSLHPSYLFFFFFTAPAPTELYTLSLHDALPISISLPDGPCASIHWSRYIAVNWRQLCQARGTDLDRKSTRLNSSHVAISYAVFCLKKKNTTMNEIYFPSFRTLPLSILSSPSNSS